MLEQVNFTAGELPKEDIKRRYKELVGKLVVLQQQARAADVGLVVLFEGWDGAGKGSRISDLMYELDARATSVHVTPAFDEEGALAFAGREWGVTGFKPTMAQFWEALGERGTITFFDEGWYRAAIDQTFFETAADRQKALKKLAKKVKRRSPAEDAASRARGEFHSDILAGYQHIAHDFEKMLVDDGYVVIKLFVHVSKEAQSKRLTKLRENPATAWQVSDKKLMQASHYDDAYLLYDRLLEMSNFAFAPWTLVNGEDKRTANLQIAQALVDAIEGALNAEPDEAALAALKKAAENSAKEAGTAADDRTAPAQVEGDEKLEEAEAEAALQHSQSPDHSKFIIMAGYPRIDHSKPKPAMASDDEYRAQLKQEQQRFYDLELELYRKRVPLMLMYEGWDAAGKGGNIKRVAQAIDARAYTVFPSPAPTKPELMHPHLWRYWMHLPKAGHVGIYDRSWYGRVLVERVEGFASVEQWSRAYDEINAFERDLVQWGAILLKFWVDITPDEQMRRFEARQADPVKLWKITEDDWRNRDKYPQYKQAVDDMFRLTSTAFAPWVVLESDDKRYARVQALKCINEALEQRMHR